MNALLLLALTQAPALSPESVAAAHISLSRARARRASVPAPPDVGPDAPPNNNSTPPRGVTLSAVPANAPTGSPCGVPGCPCGCSQTGVCTCYADPACTARFNNATAPRVATGQVTYMTPPAGIGNYRPAQPVRYVRVTRQAAPAYRYVRPVRYSRPAPVKHYAPAWRPAAPVRHMPVRYAAQPAYVEPRRPAVRVAAACPT